jgi:thiamine-monophosphate kinase
VRVRELGEDALIAAFAEIYQAQPGVEIGIGDDGAVVVCDHPRQVISTDIATEGIHFNRSWSSPFDIGAKIAIANLADIYGMGATPQYLTVALSVSGEEEVSYLLDIARGIESIAQAHSVSVVGGDVIAGSSLTIAITALGGVESPVLRSGACVGDTVYLSQGTGRSLAGLLLLSKGLAGRDSDDVKFFQRPDFHPGDLPLFGFENISALMDVSDGLISDLSRIARASGVGIDLDIQEDQLAYLRELAERVEVPEWELFLRSGEEHSFIVVIPEEHLSKVPTQWIKIGKVVAGDQITSRGGALDIEEKSWHWQLHNLGE